MLNRILLLCTLASFALASNDLEVGQLARANGEKLLSCTRLPLDLQNLICKFLDEYDRGSENKFGLYHLLRVPRYLFSNNSRYLAVCGSHCIQLYDLIKMANINSVYGSGQDPIKEVNAIGFSNDCKYFGYIADTRRSDYIDLSTNQVVYYGNHKLEDMFKVIKEVVLKEYNNLNKIDCPPGECATIYSPNRCYKIDLLKNKQNNFYAFSVFTNQAYMLSLLYSDKNLEYLKQIRNKQNSEILMRKVFLGLFALVVWYVSNYTHFL